MKFNRADPDKRVQDPSNNERKSLIEIRMEMIALLLSRRSKGENEDKKNDATLPQS